MTERVIQPGTVILARNAVATVFILNGLNFATLFSRVPDLRERLDLSNGALGLLLLSISVGSLLGLPASGRLIERFGAAGVVRGGAVLSTLGLGIVALGVSGLEAEPVVAAGLGCYGFGTAVWDVAMNVEGAEVERHLGRTVLPRFHAAWSFGSIGGAGIGVVAAKLAIPLPLHFMVVGVATLVAALVAVRAFLVVQEPDEEELAANERSAWLEPRTLAIGAMVLAFTLAEGSANDWLALALVDGHAARHWVGVAGFALFVTAMTTGRLVGPVALDRFGRVPVLLASAAAAFVGPADRHRQQQPPAGRGRHRGLGSGGRPGLPGRHERRGRRPATRGPAGLGGRDDRVRRVPRRPAAARVRGQRGRHPRLAVRRGRGHGAGGRAGAGRTASARRRWGGTKSYETR